MKYIVLAVFLLVSLPAMGAENYRVNGKVTNLIEKVENNYIQEKYCIKMKHDVSFFPNVAFFYDNEYRVFDWDKKKNYYIEYVGTSGCTVWQPKKKDR